MVKFESSLIDFSDDELAVLVEEGRAMHHREEVVPRNSLQALSIARSIRLSGNTQKYTYGNRERARAVPENQDINPTEPIEEV